MVCLHRPQQFQIRSMAIAIVLSIASVSVAATNSYVPASGGLWNTAGNWSLGHTPVTPEDVEVIVSGNAHKAVTYGSAGAGQQFNSVTIDGGAGGYYGAIWHLSHVLDVDDMYIGDDGEAYHWMEGPAYLNVVNQLYVGFHDPGPGFFYLATDAPYLGAGVVVDGVLYVGYSGPGQLDHVAGGVQADNVYIGQNDTGEYNFGGTLSGSILDVTYNMVVGNGAVGEFEQTGGTVNNLTSGSLIIGLNTGGDGTYLMKGGEANFHHISIAFNGEGAFTQTGGTVNATTNINVGSDGTHPLRAAYTVSDADASAALNIGGDLNVGEWSLGDYEQTGGAVDITGNMEIWQGTTSPSDRSLAYLNGGTLDVGGEVINHSGYYDQDSGVLSTSHFTNNSTWGITFNYTADARINNLTNTQGMVTLMRDAKLRGTLAFPPSVFFLCNFTNDGAFQMGGATFDGGEFAGTLTNNGTFIFNQGDFSRGALINNGTFYCNQPFSCTRFEQNAYSFSVTTTCPITASGSGQVNAIENNNNFTIENGAYVTLGAGKPFVNNNNLYAGGQINGDLENNDYLLPATGSAIGELDLNGDFTQASTGELRIRLGGTSLGTFDRILVQDVASFAGELDVRLSGSHTPTLGNTYTIMRYASRTGQFDTLNLPALTNPDWEWLVLYSTTALQLSVVERVYDPGDCDEDGDVDMDDFADHAACLLGPGGGLDFNCPCHDLDDDGDVTLHDHALLQHSFTGP